MELEGTVVGNERGYTYIELLVVVIIVGILAAIAIPAFIAHQDHAAEAAATSDLRNGAMAAAACAADNNPQGSFVGCGEDNLVNNYGWTQSAGTQVQVTSDTDSVWAAEAYSEDDSDQTVITYDTESNFR